MTKKDYESLATALRRVRALTSGDVTPFVIWNACLDAVAGVLAADNERFNRDRFYAAADAIPLRDNPASRFYVNARGETVERVREQQEWIDEQQRQGLPPATLSR